MQAGPEYPVVSDMVLVGGGHAHALVLRMWAMNPLPGVRITVINPGPTAPYTGMLPGFIAGHYARQDIMIDLIRLARFAGARVILDRVVGIDTAAKRVLLQSRPPITYDVCSLDIGIASDLPEVPGFAEHAVAAKPLGDFSQRWDQFLARALPAPQLVVIGAGIGGVELALAARHRLGTAAQISLLERGGTVLPGIGAGARRALLGNLATAQVSVHTSASPAQIATAAVILQDGRSLASDFTLSVAGGRPQSWLGDTGLALQDGFVSISDQLQSSNTAIFAVGDCAHMATAPRPKAGVFAVRAAPVLLYNLRAALLNQPLRRYVPQRDYLKLISTGGKGAVADKWGLPLDGAWLWRLKDQIDRKFMAKFGEFPAMPLLALPAIAVPGLAAALGDKPMCGGCGAKLGAADLSMALAGLPAPSRSEVLSGPGDDAAILRIPDGVQLITTDHLRAFTHDARLMAQIAATHALGDIWAMGASPQVALAQITLPRLSGQKGAEMLAEIMAVAAQVFRTVGADVVGGHTSVGAELTIGFTITGLASRAISKAHAQVGDVLILTKPLGSGTIMAAEMAMARVSGVILGEAVAGALAAMCHPMGSASAVLAPHATAMTDITGFGLAGHLMEILQASRVAATLNSANLPLLPGAMLLALAGHASSLAPANRAAVSGRIDGADHPLLYDPQTAGGLLASVPASQADQLLAQLLATGETAAIIGTITKGPARITLHPLR